MFSLSVHRISVAFARATTCLFLVPLLALAPPATAAGDVDFTGFDAWLAGFRERAIREGIRPETVAAAFADIEPDPRVIEFDRRQPEFVQTFNEYLQARVTPDRIAQAREFLVSENDLLARVSARYGVEPEFIVAFWGLESAFGKYQGKYQVVRSLATLAYDARRSAFFTKELLEALRILDEGHVTPDGFVGGWAGAMGQNQFIPSSFRRFAQDFDGDGRKNIWTSRADVFASIANYLHESGWKQGAGWGARVTLPDGFDVNAVKRDKPPAGCRAMRDHTRAYKPAEWRSRGIDVPARLDDGRTWAMIIPDDGDRVTWVVGGNYRRILDYNCANKYAVSIGWLADLATQSAE